MAISMKLMPTNSQKTSIRHSSRARPVTRQLTRRSRPSTSQTRTTTTSKELKKRPMRIANQMLRTLQSKYYHLTTKSPLTLFRRVLRRTMSFLEIAQQHPQWRRRGTIRSRERVRSKELKREVLRQFSQTQRILRKNVLSSNKFASPLKFLVRLFLTKILPN